MAERIGFVSTRFAGSDGVSLESAKWAQILWESGHLSFWFAGRLDRDPGASLCVPEAHFNHPENVWINEQIWGKTQRSREVTRRIRNLAEYLKDRLYQFVDYHQVSMLILENVVTIPMHVPLGVAVAEFLAETRFPAIAHHHDFYWERQRFSINAAADFLELAFPPRDPELLHTVINQAAQEQLCWRKGVPSILMPNVIRFEEPPAPVDDYAADLRAEIGLAEDDIMVLQPTRVVPRKGIEHTIKLVALLNDPRCKIVISHEAGDEGFEYVNMINELAREAGVEIIYCDDRIGELRQRDGKGRKIYTLWDLYPHADLVSYPSLYEGFGNAFLEALWFRKPVLINRYDIFARDIEPCGFDLFTMDNIVTRKLADRVRSILADPDARQHMVDHNYEVAARFYGYHVVQRKLHALISNLKGEEE